MSEPANDQRAIPGAAVLLGEEEQVSRFVNPRGQSARLQQHEGEEGVNGGWVGGWVAAENFSETNRLTAQLCARQVRPAVRAVALVEKQIEYVEHAVEPRADLAFRRNLDGDGLFANLPLGTDQTLCDGLGFCKERRRDLLHAEAAYRLQGKGHPCQRRQRRVAAHEDHGKLIVAQRSRGLAYRRGFGFRAYAVEVTSKRGVATEEIDGAVFRDLKEPSARLGGHPAERPDGEGAHEGVLHRLLGEIEPGRPEPAREPRHHLPRAVAEQMLDELANLGPVPRLFSRDG